MTLTGKRTPNRDPELQRTELVQDTKALMVQDTKALMVQDTKALMVQDTKALMVQDTKTGDEDEIQKLFFLLFFRNRHMLWGGPEVR